MSNSDARIDPCLAPHQTLDEVSLQHPHVTFLSSLPPVMDNFDTLPTPRPHQSGTYLYLSDPVPVGSAIRLSQHLHIK